MATTTGHSMSTLSLELPTQKELQAPLLPFFGIFGVRRADAALLKARAHIEGRTEPNEVGLSRTRANPMIDDRVNLTLQLFFLHSLEQHSLLSHVLHCCKNPGILCPQSLNVSHFHPVSLNCGRQPFISRGKGKSKRVCTQHQSVFAPQCRRLSDCVRFVLFLHLC